MEINAWWASGAARRHMLDKHAVEWQEVEEVLRQDTPFYRSRTVRGERRYFVQGQTEGGRRLTVVFAFEGPIARVITAYDTPGR